MSIVLPNTFTPSITEKQNIICQMSPAVYDSFVKMLSIIDDSDTIDINDSLICQNIKNGVGILQSNIHDLISTSLNLTILNPKKYVKLLKNIKGNNDVFFIDDDEYKRVIIYNGNIKVFLPKQLEDTKQTVTIPEFNEDNIIGNPIVIDKNIRSSILQLVSDNDSVELLVKDNQLKAVHSPATSVYIFDEYINENLDETNVDTILRSYIFLPINAEKYTIYLSKLDSYWLVTECDLGFSTSVFIYEQLSEIGDSII